MPHGRWRTVLRVVGVGLALTVHEFRTNIITRPSARQPSADGRGAPGAA